MEQPIPALDVGHRELVQLLLGRVPHSVRIFDDQFRCVMANDLGREEPSLRIFTNGEGKSLLPIDPRQWERWPVRRALETQQVAEQEYVVEQDEETATFLHVIALPIPGREGKPPQILEITRDMTDSKVQAVKLQRLDHALSDMVTQLGGALQSADDPTTLPDHVDVLRRSEDCPHHAMCPLFEEGEEVDDCSHSLEICQHCQISHLADPKNLRDLSSSLDELLESLRTKQDQLIATQREVLHAERLAAIGELVAGIAHEINNPLGIILARLDAVEMEAESSPIPEELNRDLQVIRAHCGRISRTVTSLLQYSRKTPAQSKQVFDVNVAVRESLEFLEKILGDRRIALVGRLSQEPLPVFGDTDGIGQVLVNLFINASDAMPEGGSLTVETRRAATGKSAEITVTDTGTGIPAEIIDRVFDPFFTTKHSRGGTGLGLSVVRRIVTEQRGTIEVESAPGEGTTFHLKLPLRSAGANGRPTAPREPAQ